MQIPTFQKPREKDFFFAWLFYRRISGPVAILLRSTFITPNQITIISIITGISGLYFLFKGDIIYDIIGLLLFQLSFLFDCIDGDLARLISGGRVKISGVYFDFFRAAVLEPLFPIFLCLGLYSKGYPILLVVGMIVTVIWRWVPQNSREHVIVRILDKIPTSLNIFKETTLLQDPPKNSNSNLFPCNPIIWLLRVFWGLPIGMMNTMTLMSIAGYFLMSPSIYYRIKFYYLVILIVIYAVYFLKISYYEFKSLNQIDQRILSK